MVVQYKTIDLDQLDLAYLTLFLGQRVNELVVDKLEAAGFENVRQSHGYVIQHLIYGDRTISDLARRLGVTQQAASKTVAEMLRLGILDAATDEDRRAKVIRISKKGWEAIHFSRKVRSRIGRRLEDVLGSSKHEQLKRGLIECLTALGGVERIRTRKVHEPR